MALSCEKFMKDLRTMLLEEGPDALADCLNLYHSNN